MAQALTRLCKADDVPDQGVMQVVVASLDLELAVYKLDGSFYVTEDMCTHGMVSLAGGDVEDGKIFCPLHGGAFDIRTGKAIELPCRVALKTYSVVEMDGDLHADLS